MSAADTIARGAARLTAAGRRRAERALGHARVRLPWRASGRAPADAIVSLTSHPARIEAAWPALRSVLRQSRPAARVILVLSTAEFEDRRLPPRVAALEHDGLEVMWVEQDARSYLKLVPVLAAEPEAVIVTADDDMLYPGWWLERLLAAHRERPGTILAHRAHRIRLRADGRPLPYLEWGHARLETPSERVFPTGVGGVLYPPGSLSDVALDTELALSLAPTADDIWFWIAGRVAGSSRGVVSDRFQEFAMVRGSHRDALMDVNVAAAQNDLQLERCLAHFGLRID